MFPDREKWQRVVEQNKLITFKKNPVESNSNLILFMFSRQFISRHFKNTAKIAVLPSQT